jgi:hypothetical protein
MAKATHYTVTESFVGTLNGAEVEYHKGEVVDADDPAVKKMPLHFEELVVRGHEEHTRATVEQATAAPGELRGEGKALTTASFKSKPATDTSLEK